MAIKRIQVKETARCYIDFEGSLQSIVSELQTELNNGWEGIETDYEYDFGSSESYKVWFFYKHRKETDQEYAIRLYQLKEEADLKEKTKQNRLERLKKELESLTDAEREQLGLK